MRKPLLLAATAATTAVLVMSPLATAFAATHDVLSTGKVGGPNVKVGAVLTAGLKTGTVLTFSSTLATLKCTKSTVTSKVTANPGRPGTATESLTAETVSGCKALNPPVPVTSVTVTVTKLPYRSTVSDAKGDPVTVSGPSATIKIVTAHSGTFTCKYSATKIRGSASNTGSLISFSKQAFSKAAGSNLVCPATGTLTVTYGPVVDTSVAGHPHVFVN
jgi:hypothetical protein